MGTLNNNIAEAVRILWIDKDVAKGQEALRILQEAVDAGNPDAYYYLARCYAGRQYVNYGFGFEEDDKKVDELLDLSIEKGSALGMFAARRFGGYEPRCGSFVHEPYHSDKEVWEAVCAMAKTGELFVKYLVANAYYYGDVIDLSEFDMSQVDDIDAQFREFQMVACAMYEELLAEGMTMGAGNYIDILTSGDYGIPKNEKKADEVRRLAADHGELYFMLEVGNAIRKTEPEKAAEYFERALQKGDAGAGFLLGQMYTYGGELPQNLSKAKQLFEDCLKTGAKKVGCNNRLGELYFRGWDYYEPDYGKAVEHFIEAQKEDNFWSSDMLGTCYLKGWGVEQDYRKAKEQFEHYEAEELCIIGLGEIYAYGLGVPQNIKRGMEYWNKLPQDERVLEHKQNFKKTLFGWKQK